MDLFCEVLGIGEISLNPDYEAFYRGLDSRWKQVSGEVLAWMHYYERRDTGQKPKLAEMELF